MTLSLGDRMKRYEAVTHGVATPRMPLMIRVDGRAFHTLTRGMNKPFDQGIMDAMVYAARSVASDMQGFKAGYVQSDEATFCITDYDRIESQGWFDYDLSKVVSISAAMMSVHFFDHLKPSSYPVFDARAFSIPASDVVNAFLWRAKDWERNSLQMYARSFFSHKQLIGKKRDQIHEMLHQIGRNWATDLTPQEKNGTFLLPDRIHTGVLPTFDSINSAIGHLLVPCEDAA